MLTLISESVAGKLTKRSLLERRDRLLIVDRRPHLAERDIPVPSAGSGHDRGRVKTRLHDCVGSDTRAGGRELGGDGLHQRMRLQLG